MITGYFGTPGCGKSTFATMIAQKELRRMKRGRSPYKRIFANYYIEGCYIIDYSQLGLYDFSDSLILLDELTLEADSRNFKQFDAIKKEFFIMHRHYNIDVIYFTQQWDGIDKKIRDLTYNLYRISKSRLPFFEHFSTAKVIYRVLDINDQSHELVNGYRFPNIFENFLFSTRKICFRPLYYNKFNSFERKELPPPPELREWGHSAELAAECSMTEVFHPEIRRIFFGYFVRFLRWLS